VTQTRPRLSAQGLRKS